MKKALIIKPQKKRLIRKTNECLRLIDIGNHKIQDTMDTLSVSLTTSETKNVYSLLVKIMNLQCMAYRAMLSEKEER